MKLLSKTAMLLSVPFFMLLVVLASAACAPAAEEGAVGAVAGDWAYARATYDFQATPKAGGDLMAEQGKILWILARQPDGSWLSARAVWDSNSSAAEW